MTQLNAHQAACMQIHEVLATLRVDVSSGLSSDDVILRRMRYGENECKHDEDEPLWKKYGEQFVNPLILLLLGSAVVSLLMRQFDDALSIALAIIIVVTVAFVQEYRSEKTLEALKELVPPSATCVRDGTEIQLLAKELVPGDIIVLRMGDRVPADARLVDSIDVEIDESSFTGETHPSRKMTMAIGQTLTNGHVSHLTNIAFMGTLVRCGRARGVVIGTGHNSEFGDVFKMMQSEQSPKTPLQRSMDELGKQLSIYSFAIIGLIFLLGIMQGRAVLDMFTIAVSLAVAAIPEGLPIVVTVTLAIGVMRMARRKAIVKKLPTVESLGCVNVICCDKTGTLTKNEMTATCVIASKSREAQVTGAGYNYDGGLCMIGHEAVMGWSHPHISRIIEIACVCNNAEITRNGELHGTPTELALVVLAHKARLHASCQRFVRLKETPFNSDTKWMSVLVQPPPDASNTRPMFMVKGAVDRLLSMCTHLVDHEQTTPDATLPMNEQIKEMILAQADRQGAKGLRVIAVASGPSMEALVFAGMVGIQDPPRPGVRESIQVVRASGVDVKMITGDALHTALAIARDVGVVDNSIDPSGEVDESYRATRSKVASVHALSGDDVDTLPEHELEKLLTMTSIFYRAAPKHKLKIVKALQNMGKVTAMTGDGVNDAVALKKADIGIAMGKTGTDVCKEASDMILIDDDFPTIAAAIEEGKGIFFNIRNFVRFQLSTSIAALTLIALSTLFSLPNPLNAMQILWINIIMDGPPAQSLGVEPVDRDVRKQAPRNINEPMITRGLIVNILISASIIISGTLAVFYMEMSDGVVTPRDTTMTFTTFVFFDMWNAVACRHSVKSVFTLGLFTNSMLVMAVSGSIVGQLAVIYLPPLQRVFQTEALYLNDLFHLTLLTSSVFWVAELKKLLERRMLARQKSKFESQQSLYMI